MKSVVVKVWGMLCIVVLGVPVAWAGETMELSDRRWSFAMTPYVWGTGVQGTAAMSPLLPPANVDESFGDIIKYANLGFVGIFELRKGKFGFITDIVWLKLSGGSSALPSPFTHTVDLTSETFMGTGLAAYRAIQTERGWLDLLVGVRGWYLNTSLDVGPGLMLPGRTISDSQGWVDFIGGVRAHINLGRGFHATTWTSGGAGSSDSVVDLAGTIGYAFTDHIAANLGYRYAKVDYSKSGFIWNVQYQGPVLGVMFKF